MTLDRHTAFQAQLCTRRRSAASLVVVLLASALLSLSPGHSDALNRGELRLVSTFLTGTKWASKAVPDKEVAEYAVRARSPGGTAEINSLLRARRLPDKVLEDTFARILVAQDRVTEGEAWGWMHRLSGTPGFRTTMSKSMGASDAMARGHLAELRVADHAAQLNFQVKGIGVSFSDPNKGAPTDIDVLLAKKGYQIPIEVKNYDPTTDIDLISFRGDIQTLDEYRKANFETKTFPVFWMLQTPDDPTVMKRLRETAKTLKVRVIEDNYAQGIQRLLRDLETRQ